MAYIYKITNPKGKVYIGQTTDIAKRKQSYSKNLNVNQTKIYNSIKKYGWDSHIFEIIEECDIDLLNNRERYFQELFNCIGQTGLNCRLTKTNDKSGLFSEETKLKMSEVGKTKFEKIEKLKRSRHDWTGKKHSEETKKKMSEAAKGKPKTKDHIAKLPQNQKGKFRAKYSQELKNKMFNSSLSKKKINQITRDGVLINTFLSSNHAAKCIGLTKGGNIRSCANGKIPTAYGFIWRYVQ